MSQLHNITEKKSLVVKETMGPIGPVVFPGSMKSTGPLLNSNVFS